MRLSPVLAVLAGLVVLVLAPPQAPAQSLAGGPPLPTSSVYTDLADAKCTLVSEDKDTGATVHRCPGIDKWNLLVLYDDQRMSVTILRPDGREQPLNYWDVITDGFSSLGPRAEWRVQPRNGKALPVALIVRVNASAMRQDGSRKRTSYLAVAKIDAERSCVTAKIPATPDANQRARQAADKSATQPCLPQSTQ